MWFSRPVKVRPEVVPNHLRTCQSSRRLSASSIYPLHPPSSSRAREVQTQCRRSVEHVGHKPCAPVSTHGSKAVGRTDHEPRGLTNGAGRTASPLGLPCESSVVKERSCWAGGRLPRSAPVGEVGFRRNPSSPTPAGNRTDAYDRNRWVYESQPLGRDFLGAVEVEERPKPQNPLPVLGYRGAPNRPQFPQSPVRGRRWREGRKRGVDAGERILEAVVRIRLRGCLNAL